MIYTKSSSLYQCPSDSHGTEWPNRFTDYWLNGCLNGIAQKNIARPAPTFLLGEGGAPNVARPDYVRSSLFPWIGNSSTPIYRHAAGRIMGLATGTSLI